MHGERDPGPSFPTYMPASAVPGSATSRETASQVGASNVVLQNWVCVCVRACV